MDYNRAEAIAEKISLMNNDKFFSDKKEIFLSAFGKNGYTKFPFSNEGELTKISISGEGHTEYILMSILKEKLRRNIKTLCYSPYRLDDIEAIYTDNLLIYLSENGSVNSAEIVGELPDFTNLIMLEKSAKEVAEIYFKKASDAHLRLEEIYISSIDFKNNDTVFEKSKKNIQKYLGLLI